MNLPGKYIIVNKKNYEQIIEILFREGYVYGGDSTDINHVKKNILKYIMSNNNILYIHTTFCKYFYSWNSVKIEDDITDANEIIREEKLKRILKSK